MIAQCAILSHLLLELPPFFPQSLLHFLGASVGRFLGDSAGRFLGGSPSPVPSKDLFLRLPFSPEFTFLSEFQMRSSLKFSIVKFLINNQNNYYLMKATIHLNHNNSCTKAKTLNDDEQ